jgi:transposase
MPRKTRSYAWVHHLEASPVPLASLTPDAYEGLTYAKKLADEARIRGLQSFVSDGIVALTIEEVADDFGVTVEVLRRRVNKARRELFGPISDGAILKRSQRRRARKKRTGRQCQELNCGCRLAALTHASRRYCDEHRLPAARTRRHREHNN